MAITVYDDVPKPQKKKVTVYDEIDSSAISDTVKDTPEYLRRAGSWGSEAIAGLGDMFLNAPNKVLNLAKAGYGTAMTAAGRPDLAPSVSQDPDLLRKAFEKVGFIDPSVVPDSPAENVAKGLVQAGTVGMMAPAKSIPQLGGNVGAAILSELAGQGTEKVTGSPTAAMAARMLAVPAVAGTSNYLKQKSIDTRALNPREEVLREARKHGYKVPTSRTSKQSYIKNRMEDLAGKEALEQQFTVENQQVTNKLMRQELGLKPNEPITLKAIEQKRAMASWPYDEISRISPTAKSVLSRLRDYRSDATAQWRSYALSGKPKAHRKAMAADSNAKMLEKRLEKIAKQAGRDDLVPELRKSRTYIAKTHDIERGLNITTGDVDATKLAAIDSKRGGVATGNIKRVADFGGSYYDYATPGAREKSADVSRLGLFRAATGASVGSLAGASIPGVGPYVGGAVGLLAATAAPPALRSFMGWKPYQEFYNPRYLASRLPLQQDPVLRGLLLSGVLDELNKE